MKNFELANNFMGHPPFWIYESYLTQLVMSYVNRTWFEQELV